MFLSVLLIFLYCVKGGVSLWGAIVIQFHSPGNLGWLSWPEVSIGNDIFSPQLRSTALCFLVFLISLTYICSLVALVRLNEFYLACVLQLSPRLAHCSFVLSLVTKQRQHSKVKTDHQTSENSLFRLRVLSDQFSCNILSCF